MTTSESTVSFQEGTAPVAGTAVFEIYIKTTPEKLWDAITDPEQRARGVEPPLEQELVGRADRGIRCEVAAHLRLRLVLIKS